MQRENSLAYRYFNLAGSIRQSEQRIKRLTEWFYSQNMATHSYTDDAGNMISKGFRPETEVVHYLDTLARIEKSISAKRTKLHYLNKYLKSLPKSELEYLNRRYKHKASVCMDEVAEAALLEEIQEIEEAASRIHGIEIEHKEIIQTGDFAEDFTNVLTTLGVGL